MLNRALFAAIGAILIFIFCNTAAASEPNTRPYGELLEALKNGDKSVDFKSLRIAYTKTKDYDPYATVPARNLMADALNQNKFEDAVKYAQEILKTNYVDFEAHVAASVAFAQLGDQEKARFHRSVFRGLVKSVLNSGDGKSPVTAWVVINISEEYVILRTLGFHEHPDQSLIHLGGHDYDKFTFHGPKTEGPAELYFNIDIPYHWLQSRFK